MLFSGHLTIFAITFFIERFKWWNCYGIEKTYHGTFGKYFSSWFTIIMEIHSAEYRVCDQSWNQSINRCSRYNSHNFFIKTLNVVGSLPLERVRTIVSCVWVSKSYVKYWARDMLYKLGLLNRPELNKVYHSFYNLFLGRIQEVKIRGVSENTLSKIIYRIRVLQELNNCINWRSLRKHYQILCDDWLMVMI